MEFHFWIEIREIQLDGTLVKMVLVRPLLLNDLLNKRQVFVWYHDEISLANNSMVGIL